MGLGKLFIPCISACFIEGCFVWLCAAKAQKCFVNQHTDLTKESCIQKQASAVITPAGSGMVYSKV